jgi:glycosyltransferase involved in cell wall biosynthesis
MKIFIGRKAGYKLSTDVFPFVKTFITYLEKRGIEYSYEPSISMYNFANRADIALCIQWGTPVKIVSRMKSTGVKIVHRLDGRAKSLVKIYNKDEVNRKVNKLADWTIFQSKYVKEHTTNTVHTIFGWEPPICQNTKNSSIIYNGVDREIFNENGDWVDLKGEFNILHVSFTAGIRKGLKDVLEIAKLLKNNPEFHFYLIGRQDQDLFCGRLIRKFDNITHLGVIIDRTKLATYLRSCQALLFPSKNDYCPNTVLEAMSCGLPVCYHDSGGTPELVVGGDFISGVKMMPRNPIYPIFVLREHLDDFRDNAIKNVKHRFTMEIMGDAYLELFKSLLDQKK